MNQQNTPRTPWTPAEAILAHRLRVRGLSCAEIADYIPGRTGAAVKGLFKTLRKRGIKIADSKATHRSSSKRAVCVPLVQPEAIKKERDAGLSLTAIAQKYGIGRTSVSKYAKMAQQMENPA